MDKKPIKKNRFVIQQINLGIDEQIIYFSYIVDI